MAKKEEKCCKNPRLGAVGGSAVIEGVMMKGGDRYAVAARTESGEIRVAKGEFVSVKKKHKWLNIPILRGVIGFVESMILSLRAMGYSATLYGSYEDESGEVQTFGKRVMAVIMIVATVLAVALSLALFQLLPAAATRGLTYLLSRFFSVTLPDVAKTALEGLMKFLILLTYLILVTLMKDIRRTFEYHGAEHKSIFCYEAGEELTVENVRKFKRFHPRCGTSFLFVMILLGMLISMLPFVPWDNVWARVGIKIALLPVVMGLGYEFLMLTGKHPNRLTAILSAPGMWVQRITTREPDDSQIEVAIVSLKCALPEVFGEQVPENAILTDPDTYAEELKAKAAQKKQAEQAPPQAEQTQEGSVDHDA